MDYVLFSMLFAIFFANFFLLVVWLAILPSSDHLGRYSFSVPFTKIFTAMEIIYYKVMVQLFLSVRIEKIPFHSYRFQDIENR